MTTDISKVTIHMVASLDGFIEKPNQDVSWMDSSDNYAAGIVLKDEDIEAFLKSIDCYVMGSRTYELARELGWPYGDVPVIVLTHRELPGGRDTVEFYSGDLDKLVNEQLKPRYKNIWLVGGARVVKDFIRLQLADEIRLTVVPVILGGGTLFFDHVGREQPLHLKEVTPYQNGMVELWYAINKG